MIRALTASAALAALLILADGVGPARADQTDPRLDALFAELQTTTDPARADALTERIWTVWLESSSAAASVLVQQGIIAMRQEDHQLAMDSFDAAIAFAPEFAEAWNKRATLFFIMGNYQASIADIQQVLALEPRHFGAWSGLAQMYETMGNLEGALAAFEKTREINPHIDGLDARIEKIEAAIKARNI